MLQSLTLKNFTVFSHAQFDFALGLNVLVGENGSGKTHVLKVGYVATHVGARKSKLSNRLFLRTQVADKLRTVFKPDELGGLVHHNPRGRHRFEVRSLFSQPEGEFDFSLNGATGSNVTIDKSPSVWTEKLPVYIPSRELLTIYPGFVSLYETTHLQFEETWRDTCVLLGAPLVKAQHEKRLKGLLGPLESAMGGKLEVDDAGRFYLNAGGVRMEMHLVAEGLRKLAMIARLIANGSLGDDGILFWDEPEANLNPKIIKVIARTILQLCQRGIQVFIASHSLFLIRELDILLQSVDFKGVNAQFFGLHPSGAGISVLQGGSVDDIGQIDALQEELSQSDRYVASESE